MLVRILLVLTITLSLGCGKQRAPAPKTQPGAGTASEESAGAASSDAQLATLLGELTQVVRKYSVEQRAVPQSFDDLVAKGYLPAAPQAPAGKRFAINKNLQVYLADQ